MSVDTVTLFLALLAGLAAVGSVMLVISMVTGDPFGLLALVRPVALELAAAVAVTATAGSLYLSEGANYDPCRLCWIQRGFMYPAAVLLVLAIATKRLVVAKVAGGLAVLGLPVSIFHRYEQAAGSVGDLCAQDNPCSLRWVEHFGFMTTPTMAGIGFATIAILVSMARSTDVRPPKVDHNALVHKQPKAGAE